MTEQVKVPEIRFAGFTDPWEQRKFSDVAMIKRGLTYSPTDIVDGAGGIRVLRSSNINEDQFVLNNDDVFVNEGAVTIDLVHDGDILITAANGSPRLVGKRARISDLPGKTVQGGFMLVASSPCSDFLCASMGSSWYRRFLATGVAGGNGAIGNLDSKALGETTIAVPNDAEKDKIGCFFTRLDSLITLHQRKYDKLVVFKKSMLEKMFPKDGESVPEIRFAGFTDPWEQRKLGEVATFGGGHTPPMADPDNYEDGYVLWVTSQDVKSNYLDRTTTQITEKGAKELTLYPAGSLVMVTRSGILRHTLPVAELRKPSTVNQDIRVILPQGECCGEWLLQFFISHNKELLLEFGKTGTTVESVDFGKIKDMLLYMPSTVEQQQIGDFFAKLDSLITLHQRKLELLQNIKKSLLDKMFV